MNGEYANLKTKVSECILFILCCMARYERTVLMAYNIEFTNVKKKIIEMEKEIQLTGEQVKGINRDLRFALRNGNLPFKWRDEHERRYRRIVYEMGLETGRQFKVTKVGVNWTVEDVGERKK